jgi:hypothetical protein
MSPQGPPWGMTAQGFVPKPASAVLSDMQTQVLSTTDDTLDLSDQTPDGQMLAVVAAPIATLWQLLAQAVAQNDRTQVQGAGLDSLGDAVGIPREGETSTEVYCTCGLDAGSAPYLAGSLIVNVVGLPAQQFTNLNAVPASAISGGFATVLFQSVTPGPTPPVSPGTLTQISTPLTGFSSVTNPSAQSQLGTSEELDVAYATRQEEELAVEGSCTPAATAAAIIELGAQQQPPVTLIATILENDSPFFQIVNGISLPPHSYAPIVYETDALGWLATQAGQTALAAVLWQEKPAGIAMIGSTSLVLDDPVLGEQTVYYTEPTPVPLYLTFYVVQRASSTLTFTQLQANIISALLAASTAPTPTNGPAPGQLAPGGAAVGSQFLAVVMGVAGVQDCFGTAATPGTPICFGTSSLPSNTAPILAPNGAASVFTLSPANITITLAVGVP